VTESMENESVQHKQNAATAALVSPSFEEDSATSE